MTAAHRIVFCATLAAMLLVAAVLAVSVPGQPGEVNLEGDAFQIGTSSDRIELRELVKEVVDTIDHDDLAGLKQGNISTSEGYTEYYQSLRLLDENRIGNTVVNFLPNDENVLSDYLIIDTKQPFFSWEIQFPEGLKSEINPDGSLDDLNDVTLHILEKQYVITSATQTGENNLTLHLFSYLTSDTLREGETRSYIINNTAYNITLIFVSDPSEYPVICKFDVNGEVTDELAERDIDVLENGLQIGVRDILINAREGVASFLLGDESIVFQDNTAIFANDFDGTAAFNGAALAANVTIHGQYINPELFEIDSIKYLAYLESPNDYLFVGPHETVRDHILNQEAFLGSTLDFAYEGLTSRGTQNVDIFAYPLSGEFEGVQAYALSFTNINGRRMSFPLLSNLRGVWKYGNTADLVFVEGMNTSDPTIGLDDWIIVSNAREGDEYLSSTVVMQYVGYDAINRTAYLEEQRNVDAENREEGYRTFPVALDESGVGTFAVGGHFYTMYVYNTSSDASPLAMDLNGDGDVAGDVVTLTTNGGTVIDIASAIQINSSAILTTNNRAQLSQYVRDGSHLTNGTENLNVSMTIKVFSDLFDTDGGDEISTWNVYKEGSDGINLTFVGSQGPKENSLPSPLADFGLYNTTVQTQQGMTDWGITLTYNSLNHANLTFDIPERQRLAGYFVTMGYTVTVSNCGNGVLNQDEQCDDGNTVSNDHCSSTCMIEQWCGDGIDNSTETCTNCPTDAGTCTTSRSGGGGGGGGGGGYIPPRKNETQPSVTVEPEPTPEPEEIVSEESDASLADTAESVSEPEEVGSEPATNEITGAFLGVGKGSWLGFTLITSVLALLFGLYAWLKK